MFYFASPMTDPESINEPKKEYYIRRNERIVNKLENAGIKIYLPQRDTDQSLLPKEIFLQNIEAIKKSNGIILLLSDSRGIYMEAGFAKAFRKKVIGLKVDETRSIGKVMRNYLDSIVNSADELITIIRANEDEDTGNK